MIVSDDSDAEEAVLEPPAGEEVVELARDVPRQDRALRSELCPEGGVVLLDEAVEESLFGAAARVSGRASAAAGVAADGWCERHDRVPAMLCLMSTGKEVLLRLSDTDIPFGLLVLDLETLAVHAPLYQDTPSGSRIVSEAWSPDGGWLFLDLFSPGQADGYLPDDGIAPARARSSPSASMVAAIRSSPRRTCGCC